MSCRVPDTPDAPGVVPALQEANARLREQNAELQAENAELKAQLAGQAEKIARLERLISRNSGELLDAAEHR
jgi:septal ring factor EnvC (AmiA/AmiB activator)